MIKKFLINFFKIVIKTALAVSLFVVSWQALSPYFRLEHNNDGDMFRNLPRNTLDVIALGSSHIQYAFDPGVFYAESGLYSYVIGSSCQPMETSYYVLKEALKYQNPSVVIVDVFTLLPQSQVCYAEGMYYKAIDMLSGATRVEAGLHIPDDAKDVRTIYAFDLIMNHNNWKTMDFSDMDSIREKGEATKDLNWILGYVRQEPFDFREGSLDVPEPQETIELSADEKTELDQLIDLCHQENIHLIFVKTPYSIDQESADKLAAVWHYLDTKGADYIDYIKEAEDLGWYTLMDGDAWHNNSWGAEIITRNLADHITENQFVSGHIENDTMQEMCEAAEEMAEQSLMRPTNIDINKMLYFSTKYPSAVAIRYKGRSYTKISEEENEAMQALGLSKDFINDCRTDYYAFVVNGHVVQESDEPFSYTYNGMEFTMGSDEIMVNGASLYGHLGDLEFYFTDPKLAYINGIGINYTRQFWKTGCNSWVCG